MRRLRPHLSYSNAMATIAVFVALGGTSYAVTQINGRQIKDRTVTGTKLRKGTLTAAEVKGGLVQPCRRGAVLGLARIRGQEDTPATFTDADATVDPKVAFHCSGGGISARRVSQGVYHVRFQPALGALAFGNGEGSTLVSISVVPDPVAQNQLVFRVELRNPSSAGEPVDERFTLFVP